jgi:hypothetical protein
MNTEDDVDFTGDFTVIRHRISGVDADGFTRWLRKISSTGYGEDTGAGPGGPTPPIRVAAILRSGDGDRATVDCIAVFENPVTGDIVEAAAGFWRSSGEGTVAYVDDDSQFFEFDIEPLGTSASEEIGRSAGTIPPAEAPRRFANPRVGWYPSPPLPPEDESEEKVQGGASK